MLGCLCIIFLWPSVLFIDRGDIDNPGGGQRVEVTEETTTMMTTTMMPTSMMTTMMTTMIPRWQLYIFLIEFQSYFFPQRILR